jgi:amidase
MSKIRTRRSFLKAATGLAVAAPFIARFPRVAAATKRFDPSFGTASEAALAIRTGTVSSRELVEHVFRRINKYNPTINAFITLAQEQALEQAKLADEALADGKILGRLHGVPIVIKDQFPTAGIRTTSGSKLYESYVPKEDAVAVARLKSAGAIIIGKTNMPEFGGDHQSFNQVAGRTNNPWNIARTPGGSTGGGAAALASGLGFLELGSDLGGSIRNPSHFCGVYGHKPTIELVPRGGIIASPPGSPMLAFSYLPVAGPLARSAQDLQLELEITGGPVEPESVAYRWNLPPARGTRLTDYRIGYVLNDAFCPVTPEVSEVLSAALEEMAKHGARLEEGWPTGVDPEKMFDAYFSLLLSHFFRREEDRNRVRERVKGASDYYSTKVLQPSPAQSEWRLIDATRLAARRTWQDYFRTHDAFLMPTNFVPAFPHLEQPLMKDRKIHTPDGERNYLDVLRWISVATHSGCPATVAPIGSTRSGLPVGMQIMGPFLEDATPISIAGLMADLVGGFNPPPGFVTD